MNLPNKLTMARIIMVPIVVIVYLCIPTTIGVIDTKSGLAIRDILTFLIFAAASITDLLDGRIARKNNLITSFGKFADPIADKLLVNTLLIMMAATGQANLIAVLLMTARDLIVDGLRMVAAQHVVLCIVNGRTMVRIQPDEIFLGRITRLQIGKKLSQRTVSITDALFIPAQLQWRATQMRAVRSLMLALHELRQWCTHLHSQRQLQCGWMPRMTIHTVERQVLIALAKSLHLLNSPLHTFVSRQGRRIDEQPVEAARDVLIES